MKRLSLLTLLSATIVLASAPAALAADEGGGTDIIGGAPTSIAEWPWQVAVLDPPDGIKTTFQRQFCGGSLITPTTVLTAAHCVFDDATQQYLQPSQFSVLTGRATLGTATSGAGETPVTDVVYFADAGGTPVPQSVTQPPAGASLYQPLVNKGWDAAILELATPAAPPAAPIALASPSERSLWEPGDTVYATGWGDIDPSSASSYPDQMRSVALQVISDTDCGDSNSYGPSFVAATMVCAGAPPTGGKDTCQGDSGGPLVAPAGDGTYRLIGDTSFGIGCAQPEYWGIYGRVADSTMRQAVLWGAQITPGGPGTPALDRTAPTTKVNKGPGKKTSKKKAKFKFSTTEPATFTCALDKAAAQACKSPYKVKVGYGKHKLAITATDSVGNTASPETYKWKVKKKKRR